VLDAEKLHEKEVELEKMYPLVTFEGSLAIQENSIADNPAVTEPAPKKTMLTSIPNALAIAALGTLTGVLSGLLSIISFPEFLGAFGVGGGFIMVPIISAFSGDHQLALGRMLSICTKNQALPCVPWWVLLLPPCQHITG
jgi:hypothetical protein